MLTLFYYRPVMMTLITVMSILGFVSLIMEMTGQFS